MAELSTQNRLLVTALGEILAAGRLGGTAGVGSAGEEFRLSQKEALAAVKGHLEKGEKIGHIVQPGGSGKTREGIAMAYALHKHNRKSLFVVPSQQALEDFAEKAKKLCPDLPVGKVYAHEKQIGNLTFITYASLLRHVLGEDEEGVKQRAGKPDGLVIDPKDYDLLVWDEAHMYLTPNAQRLIKRFPDATHIGLTGTPRYYEGKEVSDVFGKPIYEVSLALARARGEICDYTNILIDTGLETGIRLTSPEQEESAEVARALNRMDRNRVVSHLYGQGEVKVTRNGRERAYRLAGEPAIVFVADIDHTHDMAAHINQMLAPMLKNDAGFREALRAKNIDPDDPELVIAAPIHSGDSDLHKSMSLDERNTLLGRYHRRKVLMLVSTKVLQQSLDSPITSVIFDSVPRQTYVGVGQAGMRATRPGKEMAFLFNMQDGDHPSLTFTDFEQMRGQEEGVRMLIHGKGTKEKTSKASPALPDLPMADYSIIAGEKLSALAEKRAQVRRMESTQKLTLSEEERETVRTLWPRVMEGDADATNRLVLVTAPWRKRMLKALRHAIPAQDRPDSNRLEDTETKALLATLKALEAKKIDTWGQFAAYYKTALIRRIKYFLKEAQADGEWLEPLENHEKTLQTPGDNDAPPQNLDKITEMMLAAEFGDKTKDLILGRARQKTLDQVGAAYGVTRVRARQIENKSYRQLRTRISIFASLEGETNADRGSYREIERLFADYCIRSYPLATAIHSLGTQEAVSADWLAEKLQVPVEAAKQLLWPHVSASEALSILTPEVLARFRALARQAGGEENARSFDEAIAMLQSSSRYRHLKVVANEGPGAVWKAVYYALEENKQQVEAAATSLQNTMQQFFYDFPSLKKRFTDSEAKVVNQWLQYSQHPVNYEAIKAVQRVAPILITPSNLKAQVKGQINRFNILLQKNQELSLSLFGAAGLKDKPGAGIT